MQEIYINDCLFNDFLAKAYNWLTSEKNFFNVCTILVFSKVFVQKGTIFGRLC